MVDVCSDCRDQFAGTTARSRAIDPVMTHGSQHEAFDFGMDTPKLKASSDATAYPTASIILRSRRNTHGFSRGYAA